MISTPVLFVIFNRPKETRKVFEVIRRQKPEQLFIAADGARPSVEGEARLCAEARDIAHQVDWPCAVKTLFRDENLGCQKAVSRAISWFFEHVEDGIILEDDCLPSDDFFRFCEELLPYYRHDTRVMQISGTNKGLSWDEPYSYFFSSYVQIWGWATWRRAWKHCDIEMKHWPSVRKQLSVYFPEILERTVREENYARVVRGEQKVWGYPWHLSVLMQHGLAVIPRVNMISNIGMGEGATNTTNANDPFANLSVGRMESPVVHPPFILYNRKFEEVHRLRTAENAKRFMKIQFSKMKSGGVS